MADLRYWQTGGRDFGAWACRGFRLNTSSAIHRGFHTDTAARACSGLILNLMANSDSDSHSEDWMTREEVLMWLGLEVISTMSLRSR